MTNMVVDPRTGLVVPPGKTSSQRIREDRSRQKCFVCHEDMLVAIGQAARYHGRATSPYIGGCRQYRHGGGGNKELKKG